MRSAILQVLSLAFFFGHGLATITSPTAGDQWPVEQDQMIMWDTTGLTEPIDIHLVPAGATDTTVIITEIALQTGNAGTLKWAPPATITTTEVAILIVDAKKITVLSETFIILIQVMTPLRSRLHSVLIQSRQLARLRPRS
ncbi:hypothetical protein BDZ45DRAFT_163022 [Acephala macrosclerotiorum]|nr:hypothetical protein BDZ45DRAFT_163022 [Acephala macrosclerotiorum]